MIERYTLPAMGNLWTDRYKYQTWLEVEIAVCEAQAELGYIPGDAVEEIKAKANFDPDRILEIEAERLTTDGTKLKSADHAIWEKRHELDNCFILKN